MPSALTVTFALLTRQGQRIDETELLAHPERYRAWLQDDHEYEGVMDIRDAPNPPILVEDSLIALVKNLCFLGLPDLLMQQPSVYRYYSHYDYLRLDPEGHRVLLSGGHDRVLRVARAALVRGFYTCGCRFIQLLTHLQGDPPAPNVTDLIDFLEPYRVAAQTALAQGVV